PRWSVRMPSGQGAWSGPPPGHSAPRRWLRCSGPGPACTRPRGRWRCPRPAGYTPAGSGISARPTEAERPREPKIPMRLDTQNILFYSSGQLTKKMFLPSSQRRHLHTPHSIAPTSRRRTGHVSGLSRLLFHFHTFLRLPPVAPRHFGRNDRRRTLRGDVQC
uniref:Uncharacterized protein n=1 Tax=Denticeps clupeoides TaxID=299321 RepID=A0A8C4ATS3_9TELE